MSHVALQRVMVRMLYDPGFADRVLETPDDALARVELTTTERDWLLAPDSRSWKVDPDRPARSLTVLLQQYPASSFLAVRGAGPEPLLAYFRSERFHRCIQEKGSMALAYGDYLGELVLGGKIPDRRAAPLAALERAIVQLHRSSPARPPGGGRATAYRLSPDHALHRSPAGTADLHEEVHRALGATGPALARTVLRSRARIPDRKLDPSAEEPLLLELARTGESRVLYSVAAVEITEELYGLLAFAREPRTFGDLAGKVARLGAERDEAPEVIEGLIGEGTLVPAENRG